MGELVGEGHDLQARSLGEIEAAPHHHDPAPAAAHGALKHIGLQRVFDSFVIGFLLISPFFISPVCLHPPHSPQEAVLGQEVGDLGVFQVLERGPHLLGGVLAVEHRHRQQLGGNLRPAEPPRPAGDLLAECHAGGGGGETFSVVPVCEAACHRDGVSRLHFAGDPPHGDGDVVPGAGVQVFPLDGDQRAAAGRTPRWDDCQRLGVLDRDSLST